MSNEKTKPHQRRVILYGVIGTLVIAIVGILWFDIGRLSYREDKKPVSTPQRENIDNQDTWRAQQEAKDQSNAILIGEVKTQIQDQQKKTQMLGQAVEALTRNNRALAFSEVNKPSKYDVLVLEKPLPAGNRQRKRVIQRKTAKIDPPTLNTPLGTVDIPPKHEVEIITFSGSGYRKGEPGISSEASSGISEVLSFPKEEKAKKHGRHSMGADGKIQTIEFLPAGSFVRVAMLNGVDAPTGGQAESNPLPVAFHVLDLANLANKHRLDIKGCRIIAATWGDLSSERMMGRTETLSCIINGEIIEMPIHGHVIGEDGKAGVRGRLVTKQGQLLANALFASAFSGIGKSFQSSSTLTSVGASGIIQTPESDKVGQAAIGGGLGHTGHQLAQYYLKAADRLYPVIETDGGRTVEILITRGAVYTGKLISGRRYRGFLSRSGTFPSRHEED